MDKHETGAQPTLFVIASVAKQSPDGQWIALPQMAVRNDRV